MSSARRFRCFVAFVLIAILAGGIISRHRTRAAGREVAAASFRPTRHDADHAVTRVATTAPEKEAAAAVEPDLHAWMQRDPAGARRWIMAEPDEARRDRLIALGALTLADTDACTAMEWAVGSIHSDELLEAVALAILDAWAVQRPAQVASLVDQLPEGPLRQQAAERVAQHWSKMNPTTAYIWMKGSPESERLLTQLASRP